MNLLKLTVFVTVTSLFTPTHMFAYTCYGDDEMCQAVAPAEGCATGWCSANSHGICIFDGCPR